MPFLRPPVTPALRAALLVALALVARTAWAQEFDDTGLQLAETLRDLGRYDACAVEALRHAHAHPGTSAGVDLAVRCLVQAGRWAQADAVAWHPRHASLLQQDEALRWRGCVVGAVGQGAAALPEVCAPGPDRPRLTLLPAAVSFASGDWDGARRAMALAADATETAEFRADAQAWLQRAAELPAPSPLAAAALSAVVPGLGRVYLGRWQEGLTSLMTVGVPAWFAYNGFDENGTASVRGWLLATTATVFYLGNVYGSWVGAEMDRSKTDRQLRDDVRDGLSRWVDR